jgi:hypothetical protein
MRQLTSILFTAATTAACAPEPDHGAAGTFVVENIDRDLSIVFPRPGNLYVSYRAISYPGRLVEYGLRVGDDDLTAVYWLEPEAALPLRTAIYRVGDPLPQIEMAASDTTAEVRTADDLALTVSGYTDPATAIATSLRPLTIDATLRTALDAVLVARGELAAPPSFWQNRDDRAPDGDVHSTSTAGRPVVTDWNVDVSLLGALFRQGPCVEDAGFACPCFRIADQPGGPVPGPC